MAYPMMLNLEKMSCRILRVYADSKKKNTDTSAVVSLLMQLYLAIDYNLTENRQYMRYILRYICRHTPPYIFIWIFNVVSPPYLLSFLTFVAASNFLASSFVLYTQQSIFFYHFIMINDVPFHPKYRVQNGFYCSATLQLLLNSHQIRNFSLFRSSVNFHL